MLFCIISASNTYNVQWRVKACKISDDVEKIRQITASNHMMDGYSTHQKIYLFNTTNIHCGKKQFAFSHKK